MADDKEEKIIAAAMQAIFKSTKIPAELYDKLQHELRVDEHEVVKVNMTVKRGLVLEIEEDSHFRPFLNTNDIVLTVNDKVAVKPDFKLQDLFKERGTKSFLFTYLRMKNITDERIPLEDGEKKDGYDYRVLALFHYQRISMGLIMQSFQGNKVMVMDVAPRTIGAMCLLPGDCILQINGVKQGSDAAATLENMAKEMELKGFVRVTVERPSSEVAKATAAFTIQQDHRDLPVPADCAAYIKEALKLLKGPEPKSIMKSRSSASEVSVGFHERIHAESVIPSDIADELLVKTPARVPAVTAQMQQAPPPQPPSQPPTAPPETDKEPSLMGKPPSIHGPPPAAAAKESKKSVKTSKKATASEHSKGKGRKKPSAEFIMDKKSGKKTVPAGTQEKLNSKSKTKKKSKKAPENHTATGGDTEGTGH